MPPMLQHCAKAVAVAALAGLLVSCDSPEKKALRELSLAGVEPTGSALLDAVENGRGSLIEPLLTAGVHTERRDPEGRTPLRLAVDSRNPEVATRLIVGKADVNSVAADGSCVLAAAVSTMPADFVARLLDSGAAADGPMKGGEKVVAWAIRTKRFDLVEILMTHAPDPHLKDGDGNPLLHVAMKAGRRDLADILISRGADPGEMNASGETTLHAAIGNGWYDFIPTLVKAGADPNLPLPGGLPPLSQAVIDGKVALVSTLLKSGADPQFIAPTAGPEPASGKSALELAFFHGDPKIFEPFERHGVRFPKEKIQRWFSEALAERDLERVGLFLGRGADPSRYNEKGWLPIEAAAARGDGGLVKLLSFYGSPEGRSMHLAAARGDIRMAKLLLSLGMDPDVVHPPFLDRPLSIAIRKRHDAVGAALVRHGAATKFPMPEGQTPFHFAIVKGCPETVGALLESGADPNAPFVTPAKNEFVRHVRPGIIRWSLKSDRNITPLMAAADSGSTATATHLIRAGATKNTWARVSRLWPINFASRRGDVKMMRLILGCDPHVEKRHIIVNLGEQKARLFDAEGNEIFSTKVSTGRKGYATPTGTFVITNKHRTWTSTIYHSSMPFFQRLSCSDFGFHTGVVPGYPASHGCIRVPAANAAKLFSMTEAGDRVMIVP